MIEVFDDRPSDGLWIVIDLAGRLLSEETDRKSAALAARELLAARSTTRGAVERNGLLLLAIADLRDESGRWAVDLASIAEWRDIASKDPVATHWWSMVVPGLTTSNPIEAEDHIQTHAGSAEELDTIDPRKHFSPRWTPDRVELLTRCLRLSMSGLDADESLVASATIDEMSEWLQWREPDVQRQLVRKVIRVVEAISDGDANALFMIRASLDLSGEDIVGMIQRPSTPVEPVTDLRLLVPEALPAGDSNSLLHVRLIDREQEQWSLRMRVTRSGTSTVAVLFDGLDAVLDAS